MPRRRFEDDDRDAPRNAPRRSSQVGLVIAVAVSAVVLIALVGGGALWIVAGRHRAAARADALTETNEAARKDTSRQPEPGKASPIMGKSQVPDQFSHTDPILALHYWAVARDKAPYPLAEETGNRLRDKSRADWAKDRNEFIASRPVRWRMTLAAVNAKGEGALADVTWPYTSPADVRAWWGEKMAVWTDSLHQLRVSPPEGRGGFFPITDRDWAKTLSAGDAVVFVGSVIISEQATLAAPVEYDRNKVKHCLSYFAVSRDGHIEKP